MDSDALSDSSSSPEESCESGDENDGGDLYETCCFNKRIFQVPQYFCSDEEVFKEVLSIDTWRSVLNSKHGERLKKFLPVFPNDDEKEKSETLKQLIQGDNFKFGNPLQHLFQRMKDGFLSSDVVEVSNALKQANYREYKNQQRQYSFNIFKEILLTRKKLIDASYTLPPDQPVKMQQFIAKPKDATLLERTRLRYFSALQDLRDEIGEMDTSSEDENYPESMLPKVSKKLKKQLQNHENPLSPEMTRISSTMFFPSGFSGPGSFLNNNLDAFEVSEERYREMLQNHKERAFLEPNHPVLNISHIDLKGITARCNLLKRNSKAVENGKKKIKLEHGEKSVISLNSESMEMDSKSSFGNLVIKEEPVSFSDTVFDVAPPMLQETEVQTDPLSIPNEIEDPRIFENKQLHTLVSSQADIKPHPSCFFSLIRDIFCESPEQKLSASKLEEKVKTWQGGPTAALFEWLNAQESWSDLVSSALKFLAGDLINILPETFVPFLDYKEKQQLWQWIGSGRDADEQLYDLCQQWLESKNISSDILETSQASPPPPRVTTGWTVRTTVDEEKKVYREQECVRYQNPHKAFTFKVHGYEAVVGPVKGVYGKESGINKAREHSLLTSDRPPFVTILSLVRDSAARLPNGEGTRADICELLKDSQYLAPASDQQIHTVVSGALDRLHYEKDPCVKYDVNRKLWIYLHRHRTEEEFERIHQAQAAAAKARKAVQKNKLPKFKNKETARSISCAQHTVTNTESVTVLNVDLPSSVSAPLTTQTVRTQASQASLPSGRFLMHTLPVPTKAEIKCAVLNIDAKSKTFDVIKSEVIDSLPSSSTTTVIDGLQASTVTSKALLQAQEKITVRQTTIPSTLTLSSPKNIIGNLNATQIVSVTPVQLKPCSTDHHMHDVLNVDMKPSSPSFVGQPPVLQPILSHQTLEKAAIISTLPTVISTNTSTMTKAKINCAAIPGLPAAALAGFQTIVIKQDPGLRTCNGMSTIPLLSIEERLPTSNSSGQPTGPVVARLVHGSQYLSFGNLVATSTACGTAKPIGATVKNFRVQGGNICQQVLSASTIKVMHSTPVSAITDSRLPVIAIKNPSGTLKDHSVITTTPTATLNLSERLYQMASIRNAIVPKEVEGKTLDISLKEPVKGTENNAISTALTATNAVYSSPIALARNAQTVIKLSPK